MRIKNPFPFLFLILTSFLIISCGEKVVEEIKVKHTTQDREEQTSSTKDTSKEETGKSTVGKDNSSEKESKGSIITTTSAENYVGQNVTVKGYVADVHITKKVAYLNFDNKYPKNTFTGVIFARKFSVFDNIEQYEGKTVELTGEVSKYKGKAQIILESKDQIKISN